jgi:ApaG protein
MITEVTNGIKVSVETAFVPEQSDIENLQYVYAYRITIENDSHYVVQLLRRHWLITDTDCSHKEVEGEGVIGEKPVIQPGESYSYSSGCSLLGEIGRMKGTYLMLRHDNFVKFEVNIPEFILTPFYMLN